MMRRFAVGVLVALMSGALWAQEAPTENPTDVYVKGRKVSHSWRDGRIWVPTSELVPLLNYHSDARSVDLLKALEEKGGYVFTIDGGKFEARRDRSQYSGGTAGKAYSENLTADLRNRRNMATWDDGDLRFAVEEFVNNSGNVAAKIRVINVGEGTSPNCEMVCEFLDGNRYTFAIDKAEVERLSPGEFIDFTVESPVRAQDRKRVRTITKENIQVSFLDIVRTSKPRYTATKKKKKKRRTSSKSLDFNKGYNRINSRYRPTSAVKSI